MEDMTRLVSTGDCVKIWDAVSMTPVEQFNPHTSCTPVAQACWSSNNQYLVTASGSGDKVVVSSLKVSPATSVVELAEGKRQTRVSLSSSSQFLASGGLDHCVHIWDLKTRRVHRTLEDHKEEVTCVSFNANDSVVASGSTSGDLVLHSLTTNLSSKAFGHGANQPIRDLRLSMIKRSLLASVSDNGSVVLWDANTQKQLHMFDGVHKAPGSGLAFSPASELLVVSVGLDKKIICYDTASKIILRSLRVESPLTCVDFTPNGAGLVAGSTHGKIYHYDLRNSSAPTRVTVAHRTSVTSLRFQTNSNRHKSRLGSAKTSDMRRSSTKLPNSSSDPSTITVRPGLSSSESPLNSDTRTFKPATTVFGPAGNIDLLSKEMEGQPAAEQVPMQEKFSTIGRSSLDFFSPVRDDPRNQQANADSLPARIQATGLDSLSRDGEVLPVVGRASLDIFSPVKEESLSSTTVQRKTPLGTSAARSFSPLNVFQTPQPIREEEPVPAVASESCDQKKMDKVGSSNQEGECQTTPTSSQPTNHSQTAPSVLTPEPSRKGANGLPAQLAFASPVLGAPTSTASTTSGLTAAMSSSLSHNIAEVVGQGGAAPLSSLQIHFIQNMIHETLEEFRDTWHRDIVNLQVEMVRQFYVQLNEIHGLIERYSVNESLVEEIEKLKEENRRLRTNY